MRFGCNSTKVLQSVTQVSMGTVISLCPSFWSTDITPSMQALSRQEGSINQELAMVWKCSYIIQAMRMVDTFRWISSSQTIKCLVKRICSVNTGFMIDRLRKACPLLDITSRTYCTMDTQYVFAWCHAVTSTLTVKYLAFAVTCWDFTVSKVCEGYIQGHPPNISRYKCCER